MGWSTFVLSIIYTLYRRSKMIVIEKPNAITNTALYVRAEDL